MVTKWREIRLWYSESGPINWHDLYVFKRNKIMPILKDLGIRDFLVLDEPQWLLLRVEVDDKTLKEIKQKLENSIAKNWIFRDVTIAEWSPEEDAKGRILGARERARTRVGVSFQGVPEGGWRIIGIKDGRWIAGPDDLERKTREFARFMSRVVGQFTRAYIEEIPDGVDDPWMLSVFIHLLLNSISVWQNLEQAARNFPFI